MNIKRLIDDTLIANNGEMSRGLKNQLTIVSAYLDEDFERKLNTLKNVGISVYNYTGLRILEFNLYDIQEVLKANERKFDIYRANPQELVRDLRKREMINSPSEVGGM